MHNGLRLASLATLVILAIGCKKPDDAGASTGSAPAPVAAGKAGTSTAARAAGIKADKTAGQDGPLTGDSADDGVFTLTIDGPVAALGVVSVDAKGAADGASHWDTVVEEQAIPAGWKTSSHKGSETWQLGVEENGKPLNAKNGSLTPIGPGTHTLMLYVGDASHLPGKHLMVLAERPDHSVVKSNVFTP